MADIERLKSLLGTHEDFPQKVQTKKKKKKNIKHDIFVRALSSRTCSPFSKIPLLLKHSSVTLFNISMLLMRKRLMLLLVSL